MNALFGRSILLPALFALTLPLAHADQWTTPTKEELSMTSLPEAPGAPAILLYHEQSTVDDQHEISVYSRVKVLTEGGRKYADVELANTSFTQRLLLTPTNIEARTIHPDGTIIPMTGEPYEKLIEKIDDRKITAKVFTLPDVTVGSILEYRYKLQLPGWAFEPPTWYVQAPLYAIKEHFYWKPSTVGLVMGSKSVGTIAWAPFLPQGTEVKETRISGTLTRNPDFHFDLDMNDVAAVPEDDYLPPIYSFIYRVAFYYSRYPNADDFWRNTGKEWSTEQNDFMKEGSAVKAAVKDLTAPTDTQEQKLRKLYAAIMQFENTDFTREHSTAEDKAEGFKQIHTTEDILKRKRGSRSDLTELFVAMARAAGMKAYLVAVTRRDAGFFIRANLNLYQLDDYLAIVNVDGKEQYFDPGSRYCPYGQLAWQHTMTGGLRQTDTGTEIVQSTPAQTFRDSHIARVANLALDKSGHMTGTANLTYSGIAALHWRHRFLVGDSTSLNKELREHLERLLPSGTQVKVTSIDNLEDYEKPLTIHFAIDGALGSSTGKRLLLPADIFEVNSKPSFVHEKRDLPVYFDYPYYSQDAVRITFPSDLYIESVPTTEKYQFKNNAIYQMTAQTTPTGFTVRRDYYLGEIVYPSTEYTDLRGFYSKVGTKDQDSVILTTVPPATKPAAGGN